MTNNKWKERIDKELKYWLGVEDFIKVKKLILDISKQAVKEGYRQGIKDYVDHEYIIKKIGWVYKNGNPVGSREWHVRQVHIVKHAEKEVETLLATTTKQAVEENDKKWRERIEELRKYPGHFPSKMGEGYLQALSDLLKEEGE